VNWFGLHLYWGRGNNLESILHISSVADLYLSLRMQECGPLTPQDAGMILLSVGMGYSLICLRLSDPTEGIVLQYGLTMAPKRGQSGRVRKRCPLMPIWCG
jgi:hypothetical protein